jgi:hypothetical protein
MFALNRLCAVCFHIISCAFSPAEVLPGTTQKVSMTPPGCEEEAAGWHPELVQEMGRKLALVVD